MSQEERNLRLEISEPEDADADHVNINNQISKYLSLLTLTIQNTALALSMRYSRSRSGDMFLSSTAVVNSEVIKVAICLGFLYRNAGDRLMWASSLKSDIIDKPKETLTMCVPAFLFVIQNNLVFFAAAHLDAVTCQVVNQIKILVTALFSVVLLGQRLTLVQWSALLVLIIGIVLVQLPDSNFSYIQMIQGNNITLPQPELITTNYTNQQNRALGVAAVIVACVMSGFASIYFEKILKGSMTSVWVRNLQLSLGSIPFALFTCFFNDATTIAERGYFYGYDGFVIYLIVLHALGGILVSMVVKYADNILKGFTSSLAIILSCVGSMILFIDFHLTEQFTLGTSFVILSVFLYGYQPLPEQNNATKEEFDCVASAV